jgi:PmbA protein
MSSFSQKPPLLQFSESIVERCLARGATQAECFAEEGASTSASVEQNELKAASVAEHRAAGIRVIVEGRLGFAYVNRQDERSVATAIDDAIAIARASPVDVANDFPAPTSVRAMGGLYDERIAALGVNDAVENVVEMFGAARSNPIVSVDNASFSCSHGQTALANSKGVSLHERDSAVSWALFGMAVDGGEASSFDSVAEGRRQLDNIDVAAAGKKFAERVLSLRAPKRAKAYRGTVLFAPEAFAEIFLEPLLESIDGDAVLKGRSALANKRAERIAAPGFTLVDDGTLPGALGSSSFDREGCPHRRMVLIGDGVLHHFLYDGRAARRAGTYSTGHASGSARSAPMIGTTNLVLHPGDVDDEGLLSSLKTGLQVGRFSGNVDAVSGDYSGVAKGSFWVSKGQRVWPVQETLIAGNIYRDLKHIVHRGSRLEQMMTMAAPAVLIDGISVTTS